MVLGLDRVVDDIGGDQTRSMGVLAVVEPELGVDVQSRDLFARRPDIFVIGNNVGESVGVGEGTEPGAPQSSLLVYKPGEPVVGLLSSPDIFIELGETGVVGLEQGVLPTVGVVEVDVDVAVLTALGGIIITRADGCDVLVEGQSDSLPVGGLGNGNGACWTARTGVFDVNDLDILRVGEGWRRLRDRRGSDESSAETENDGGEFHDDCFERKNWFF